VDELLDYGPGGNVHLELIKRELAKSGIDYRRSAIADAMEAMRQRNHIYKLAGDVQIDDAYLGGEKPGKPGRGAANKTPFVIAVETRENKPFYTQLRRIAGFTSAAIKSYAAASIEPGSRVTSDGLACFAAVTEAGMEHRAIVTGSGRPTAPEFKWVNTGLGNIKCAITGTCAAGNLTFRLFIACATLSPTPIAVP
jgi:hypothetical protein